jgi:glycosyltransferase involved in cell wall biosynthesis
MPRTTWVVDSITSFNSFLYAAKVAKNIFGGDISILPLVGSRNIYVGDAVFSTRYMGRRGDIYWVDTPLVPDKKGYDPGAPVYVTSRYNEELVKRYGWRVDGVIPRIINPAAFFIKKPEEHRYDAIWIAYRDQPDRKNVGLMMMLCENLNLRCIAITNVKCRFCIGFGSLSDYDKFRLIAESKYLLALSKNEGFGMPVLEAMAVGTVPIVSRIPTFEEYVKGLFVDTNGSRHINTVYGTMEIWDVDARDAEDVVRNALSMSNSEYNDLSILARERALNIERKAISSIENLIYGG